MEVPSKATALTNLVSEPFPNYYELTTDNAKNLRAKLTTNTIKEKLLNGEK